MTSRTTERGQFGGADIPFAVSIEKDKLLTEIKNMKKNEFKSIEIPQTNIAAEATSAVMSAVLAFSIGLFLIFGAAVPGSSTLHNVAHDGRHAFTVPCH